MALQLLDETPAGLFLPGETDEYGFPIRPRGSRAKTSDETPVSLEVLLGDYVHLKGAFYVRAPKLKQQKAMARLAAGFAASGGAEEVIEQTQQIAMLLLFVDELALGFRPGEAAAGMRPATAEEVEENFDLNEVTEIVRKHTGIFSQEGADPNS